MRVIRSQPGQHGTLTSATFNAVLRDDASLVAS